MYEIWYSMKNVETTVVWNTNSKLIFLPCLETQRLRLSFIKYIRREGMLHHLHIIESLYEQFRQSVTF